MDDYTTVLRTATFAAGQATTNISIPIRDDIMIEETETFIASLIPNPNVIILRNGSVTIEDDDGELLCAVLYCFMETSPTSHCLAGISTW